MKRFKSIAFVKDLQQWANSIVVPAHPVQWAIMWNIIVACRNTKQLWYTYSRSDRVCIFISIFSMRLPWSVQYTILCKVNKCSYWIYLVWQNCGNCHENTAFHILQDFRYFVNVEDFPESRARQRGGGSRTGVDTQPYRTISDSPGIEERKTIYKNLSFKINAHFWTTVYVMNLLNNYLLYQKYTYRKIYFLINATAVEINSHYSLLPLKSIAELNEVWSPWRTNNGRHKSDYRFWNSVQRRSYKKKYATTPTVLQNS